MLKSRFEPIVTDRAESIIANWEEYINALPSDISEILYYDEGLMRSFSCTYDAANPEDPLNLLMEDHSTSRIKKMLALEHGQMKFVIWGEDAARNRTSSHFLLEAPLTATVGLPAPVDRDIEQEDGLSQQITDEEAIAAVNNWDRHIATTGGISSSCFQTPHGPLRGYCSDREDLLAALNGPSGTADEICFYLCIQQNVDEPSMKNIGLIWAGNKSRQNLNGYYDRASPCPDIC